MKRECISLKKDTVWVWTERVIPEREDGKWSRMDPAEKKRLSSEKGKKLLSQMLLEQHGIDLQQEKNPLGKEGQGKPFLTHHPDIFFNISHSGGLVSCGTGSIPLGVDIQFHKQGNFRKTAEKILSPKEWAEYVKSGYAPEIFFYFWTKKESYLKYTGEGIRRELSTLSYRKVQFFLLDLEPGYTGMVCLPGKQV